MQRYSTRVLLLYIFIAVLRICLFPPQTRAADDAARRGNTLTLYMENDLFYNTDRQYTHGTKLSWISPDLAEDREKFCELLESLHIAVPEGLAVTNEEEAFEAVRRLGYPLVVRPSYVIGGQRPPHLGGQHGECEGLLQEVHAVP